ncbi:unnamed protein product [Closterium sp. Naga37s-1]|nr:unnamed protein product [Closterium sp. Naga37s-1]
MQLASRDASSRGVVANRVLIPCFLAVHVASAVSSEPELVLSSLPLIAFAQVLCAASLGHLAHQSSPQSSSSSSFLPRPLHLSPLPSTALHQLAAAISVSLSSLNQPAAEPTTEPAAKSAAAAGGSDAAGNLGGRLGSPVMTLLLLVVMTAVCETGGGGDGLAGQLALLAVGGWAPALLILACNALLWIQTRPDAMDSSLLSSPSGPSLSNHFFTPPVLGVSSVALLFLPLSFSPHPHAHAQPHPFIPLFSPFHHFPSPSPSFTSSPYVRILCPASHPPISLPPMSLPCPAVHSCVSFPLRLLIGATPLSQLFLLPRVTDGLADTSTLLIDSGSLLAWLQGQAGEMAGCMHCLMEAASFLGSAALPLHLMALVSSLVPPLEPSQAQHQQHQQQQQQQQQQQGILAPVKATRTRDAAGTSPELPL